MSTPNGSGLKIDLSSIAGHFGRIRRYSRGLLLEGGNIKDVAQVTGRNHRPRGNLGAVLVTTPTAVLSGAARKLMYVFSSRSTLPAKSSMRLSSTPHAPGAMESYRSNQTSNPSGIRSCKRLCH